MDLVADVFGDDVIVEWGTLEAEQLFQKIKFGRPRLEGNAFKGSPSALDFVQRLLVKDPNSRITVSESLLHPFITRDPAVIDKEHQPKVC